MNAPCKDCKDRELLCHSTCKKYIAFKNKVLEIKEKEQKERFYYESERIPKRRR